MKAFKLPLLVLISLFFASCETFDAFNPINNQRISVIEISNDNGYMEEVYRFYYKKGQVSKVERYLNEDTINHEYNNWIFRYENDLIIKDFYRPHSSGAQNEIIYRNGRTEYQVEDNRIRQVTSRTKDQHDNDWWTPWINTYDYEGEHLILTSLYYESVSSENLQHYEEFEYQSDSLLLYKVYTFENEEESLYLPGYLRYKDNLLSEIMLIYPEDHSFLDTVVYQYFYNSNQQLTEIVKHDRGVFPIFFEYNTDGLLSKQWFETAYSTKYFSYTYEKGKGNLDLILKTPRELLFKEPFGIDFWP